MRVKGSGVVVAAFVVSILAAGFLAFAPVMTSVTESVGVTVTPDGDTNSVQDRSKQVRRETLAESQGWRTVTTVAIPLLVLTGVPLLVPRRRWAIFARGASTLLLLTGVFLGALSFGIFYLPAAILMGAATILAFENG